jgi:adenosylcobalamin-dependent ribonucleoside-triphosphate reductase
MGQAVAERTILRKLAGGGRETWGDVADRVALGNSLLCPDKAEQAIEFAVLNQHLRKATTLMSGRHLQHGDATQPSRNMEVFTNCATSPASFAEFYLLLNGSGVGRCYDDDMMLVNWDYAPTLRCVLNESHPDFDYATHESRRDGLHKWGRSENVIWHEVQDSREGWAKALEIWEVMTFEKVHRDKLLVLDFSPVRCKGSPIGGMQNRPASGPVPLMGAFAKAATLKGAGMPRWKQAMYVDHYFAECVLVGGARRAARMATKHWSDPTVLEFIQIKRPIEFVGLSVEEVAALRAQGKPNAFLWSSNNSVTVDDEFWLELELPNGSERSNHARAVFDLMTACAYGDGTGEPGFINVHKLQQNDAGWTDLNRGDYIGSSKYQIDDETQILLSKLAKRAKKKKFHTIVNPCGEVALNLLGGYCVIADGVPFHADSLDEAEDALRASTRALIRANTMDCLYSKEVWRTNRIGVGLTGVHEFAWKFFKAGFRDLINPDFNGYEDWVSSAGLLPVPVDPRIRAVAFWLTLARFSNAVKDEATTYSKKLGVPVPHTMTTIKPAGTTSKLFLLTEGWHLPSMREFVRWVQFRSDDPLVEDYRAAGYPVRELQTYQGTTIVGFPTAPVITTLGMGDKLVTATEATPEEQFEWVRLGEEFWINGGDTGATHGNQISYTLKFNPKDISFERFKQILFEQQRTVRCCSVMPKTETMSYEYLPEQPVSHAEYLRIVRSIQDAAMAEEVSREHIDCASGACPIDFNAGAKE